MNTDNGIKPQVGQAVRPDDDRMDTESRAKRLREAVRSAGGNRVVAQVSGVPGSTLGAYLGGISGMKLDALIALADATNTNLEWLATGRGPVRPGEEVPMTVPATSSALAEYVSIPRYDVRAGAGRGIVAPDEQLAGEKLLSAGYVRNFLHRLPQHLALITARGDSMSPTILDGDQVLLDTSITELRGSGLYVLRVDDELMVKRLQRTVSGDIRVISDNPAYPEERITAADHTPLHIVGEVVYRAGPVGR